MSLQDTKSTVAGVKQHVISLKNYKYFHSSGLKKWYDFSRLTKRIRYKKGSLTQAQLNCFILIQPKDISIMENIYIYMYIYANHIIATLLIFILQLVYIS